MDEKRKVDEERNEDKERTGYKNEEKGMWMKKRNDRDDEKGM